MDHVGLARIALGLPGPDTPGQELAALLAPAAGDFQRQQAICDRELQLFISSGDTWSRGNDIVESVMQSNIASENSDISLLIGWKILRRYADILLDGLGNTGRPKTADCCPDSMRLVNWLATILDLALEKGEGSPLFLPLQAPQFQALVTYTMIRAWGVQGDLLPKKVVSLVHGTSISRKLGLAIIGDVAGRLDSEEPAIWSVRDRMLPLWDIVIPPVLMSAVEATQSGDEEALLTVLRYVHSIAVVCRLSALIVPGQYSVLAELHNISEVVNPSSFQDGSELKQSIISCLTALLDCAARKAQKRTAFASLTPEARREFIYIMTKTFERCFPIFSGDVPGPFAISPSTADMPSQVSFWQAVRVFVEKNVLLLLEDGLPRRIQSQLPSAAVSSEAEQSIESEIVWNTFMVRLVYRGCSHRASTVSTIALHAVIALLKKLPSMVDGELIRGENESGGLILQVKHGTTYLLPSWLDCQRLIFLLHVRFMKVYPLLEEVGAQNVYKTFIRPWAVETGTQVVRWWIEDVLLKRSLEGLAVTNPIERARDMAHQVCETNIVTMHANPPRDEGSTEGSGDAEQQSACSANNIWSEQKSAASSVIHHLCAVSWLTEPTIDALLRLAEGLGSFVGLSRLTDCPVMSAIEAKQFRPMLSSKFFHLLCPGYILFDALASGIEAVGRKVWVIVKTRYDDGAKLSPLPPYQSATDMAAANPDCAHLAKPPRWVDMLTDVISIILHWDWKEPSSAAGSLLSVQLRRIELITDCAGLFHFSLDTFRQLVLTFLRATFDIPAEGEASEAMTGRLDPGYCFKRRAMYAFMTLIETCPRTFSPDGNALAMELLPKLTDERRKDYPLITEAFVCVLNAVCNQQTQRRYLADMFNPLMFQLGEWLKLTCGEDLRLNSLGSIDIVAMAPLVIGALFGPTLIASAPSGQARTTVAEQETALQFRRKLCRIIAQIDVVMRRIHVPTDSVAIVGGGYVNSAVSSKRPQRVVHPLEEVMPDLWRVSVFLLRVVDLISAVENTGRYPGIVMGVDARRLAETVGPQVAQLTAQLTAPGQEELGCITGSLIQSRSGPSGPQSADNWVASKASDTDALRLFPLSIPILLTDTDEELRTIPNLTSYDRNAIVLDYVLIDRRHTYYIKSVLGRILSRAIVADPSNAKEYAETYLELLRSSSPSTILTVQESVFSVFTSEKFLSSLLLPPQIPNPAEITARAPCNCYLVDRSAAWIPSEPMEEVLKTIVWVFELLRIKNADTMERCSSHYLTHISAVSADDSTKDGRLALIRITLAILAKINTLTLHSVGKIFHYKNTIVAKLAPVRIPAPECSSPSDEKVIPESLPALWNYEFMDTFRASMEVRKIFFLAEGPIFTAFLEYALYVAMSVPLPNLNRESHTLIRSAVRVMTRQFVPPPVGVEPCLLGAAMILVTATPPAFDPNLDQGDHSALLQSPVTAYILEMGTATVDGKKRTGTNTVDGYHGFVPDFVTTLFDIIVGVARAMRPKGEDGLYLDHTQGEGLQEVEELATLLFDGMLRPIVEAAKQPLESETAKQVCFEAAHLSDGGKTVVPAGLLNFPIGSSKMLLRKWRHKCLVENLPPESLYRLLHAKRDLT